MPDRPGLVAAFEHLQGAGDLQLQRGALGQVGIFGQLGELLAQLHQMAFELRLLAEILHQRFGGGVFELVGIKDVDHDQTLALNAASSRSSQFSGVSG